MRSMVENIFSLLVLTVSLLAVNHFLKRSKIKFILKYKFSRSADEQPVNISSANNVIFVSFTSSQRYIYRRFNAIVSQLKMHYFSEGAFES